MHWECKLRVDHCRSCQQGFSYSRIYLTVCPTHFHMSLKYFLLQWCSVQTLYNGEGCLRPVIFSVHDDDTIIMLQLPNSPAAGLVCQLSKKGVDHWRGCWIRCGRVASKFSGMFEYFPNTLLHVPCMSFPDQKASRADQPWGMAANHLGHPHYFRQQTNRN